MFNSFSELVFGIGAIGLLGTAFVTIVLGSVFKVGDIEKFSDVMAPIFSFTFVIGMILMGIEHWN